MLTFLEFLIEGKAYSPEEIEELRVHAQDPKLLFKELARRTSIKDPKRVERILKGHLRDKVPKREQSGPRVWTPEKIDIYKNLHKKYNGDRRALEKEFIDTTGLMPPSDSMISRMGLTPKHTLRRRSMISQVFALRKEGHPEYKIAEKLKSNPKIIKEVGSDTSHPEYHPPVKPAKSEHSQETIAAVLKAAAAKHPDAKIAADLGLGSRMVVRGILHRHRPKSPKP